MHSIVGLHIVVAYYILNRFLTYFDSRVSTDAVYFKITSHSVLSALSCDFSKFIFSHA